MKTQILTLESHDDLISVRDRMSWAKSPRILLVWPKYERVSLRALDLRVLQVHARSLGAELGLVTRLGAVKRDAERFDIPVFETTTDAQRASWRGRPEAAQRPQHRPGRALGRVRALRSETRQREAAWRSTPLARIGGFALGALAVLILAAVFIPRAEIKLSPLSQQQSLVIPVSAGLTIKSILINGSLPSYSTSVVVGTTESMAITSQGAVPQNKAEGIARFKNLTQNNLTIPSGTVVYTTGGVLVKFVTVTDTHVPGGPTKFVETPIVAQEGGTAGNVGAGAIGAIEGTLALSASVTNPKPTEGGTDLTAVAAADADRQHLHDAVMETLVQTATDELRGSIGSQDYLLLDTLKAGPPLQETYDPPAGQSGDTLRLTMRLNYSAEYVRQEDLNALALLTLNASVPPGFAAAPETLQLTPGGPPTADAQGISHFNLQAQRLLVRQIEELKVILLARGLTPGRARQVLQSNLPLTAPPEIHLSPPWWPWLPLLPLRFSIQ